MLIKATKTKVITEDTTIELQLPAFFRGFGDFYRIAENETITNLYMSRGYFNVSLYFKECEMHARKVEDALKGTPITGEEFDKAWDKMINVIGTEEPQILRPV